MNFSYHSGVYRLHCEQQLPLSIDKAWKFFSSPRNLQSITPDDLQFEIKSLDSEDAYPGQIICYRIRLNALLKMNWVTEITQVEDKRRFIDEQRYGPYKMWHHIHHFEENEDGVLMTDDIYFKIPFGPFSHLLFKFYIKKNLENIFNFRREKLEVMVKESKI